MLDERTADEKLRRRDGIDLQEVNGAPRDLESMQHDFLDAGDAPRFFIPMRLAVFERAQMRAQLRDPVRLHLRHRACEELRGMHDLSGDDPRGLFGFVLAGFRFGVLLAALVKV